MMENKILKLRKKKDDAYSEFNYEQLYGLCIDLAQIFVDNENYDDALKEYREAEQAGEMAHSTIYVAKARRMMADVCVSLNKPREAVECALKYLELSRGAGDLKEEQRALASLARTYFVLAESLLPSRQREMELKKAEDYNMKSLQLCERLKESTSHKDVAVMKSRVFLNLGLVMEARGCTDKAIEFLQMAVAISRNFDLWEELCMSYTNLGGAYRRFNDSANALKALDLGLSAASRLPDKVNSMCNILSFKAEVLFDLPDFRGAKHALHKAFKLRTPNDSEHMEITKKLKIVAAVCRLEERLVLMDEENLLEKRKIYELMGDGCAEMESFKKALKYYELALKCAQELGESGKKIAEIYVSLAQTYKDLKQFDNALDFFHLEFAIWKDNPAEACRTTLNIAEILEAKGDTSDEEIITTYKSAQCLAKDAKNLKLQRSVLIDFIRYLKDTHNTIILESIERELAVIESQLEVDVSDESENEITGETCRIGDDICLETLTESDLDEDEQIRSKPKSSRRIQSRFRVRRNDKGETGLHTACINGNLTLVQKLLDQGHPVDIRDNNGWLPLHEAANYGYVDIVRELLDRGAAVNDRGGPDCGGITPLLDAASNGNLHVMQILLDKGASPTMRSNKGETVLDCLKEWRKRYIAEEKHDLSGETLRDYNVMLKKIEAAMEKAGHNISTPSDQRAHIDMNKKRFSLDFDNNVQSNCVSRRKSADCGLRRSIDSDSGVSCSSRRNTNKRYSNEAVSEYEKAITGLKHRIVPTEMPVSPIKESQDALLQPDRIVDTWLVDDLGEAGSSRPVKRRRKGEFLGQQLRNCEESSSRPVAPRSSRLLISSSSSSDNESTEDSSQNYQRIDVEFNGNPHRSPENISEEAETVGNESDEQSSCFIGMDHQPSNSFPHKSRKHQTTLISTGISRQKIQSTRQHETISSELTEPSPLSISVTSTSSVANAQVNRQRVVKVLVEGKLLLIVLPNDPQLTISWLAEEAARRYKSMEGLEPILSLQTIEGALLFPQDPLSLVSDLGAEIHATVTSWNMTPITQRYKDACNAGNIAVNVNIETQLDACQATSCLDLEQLGLTSAELLPALKALSHHHALQHIRLSGNVLSDSGLKTLVDTILRLSQLRELDISCNNFTSDGFSYMAQQIFQNKGFQSLEVLDVSFNHLGEDCLRSLSILLSVIPALHTLRLSSISLTSFKASLELPLENIEVLDISYNKMGQEGARGFLSRLNPDRICSLNLAAVGKFTGREVAIFLGQCVPHNLVELNLSYCDIEDADMVPLLECLQTCPQLQKLNLAGNNQLSEKITEQLMQLPLSELNLAGIHSYLPLISSISNLCVSSTINTTFGRSAPFSLCISNLKSLLPVN